MLHEGNPPRSAGCNTVHVRSPSRFRPRPSLCGYHPPYFGKFSELSDQGLSDAAVLWTQDCAAAAKETCSGPALTIIKIMASKSSDETAAAAGTVTSHGVSVDVPTAENAERPLHVKHLYGPNF